MACMAMLFPAAAVAQALDDIMNLVVEQMNTQIDTQPGIDKVMWDGTNLIMVLAPSDAYDTIMDIPASQSEPKIKEMVYAAIGGAQPQEKQQIKEVLTMLQQLGAGVVARIPTSNSYIDLMLNPSDIEN